MTRSVDAAKSFTSIRCLSILYNYFNSATLFSAGLYSIKNFRYFSKTVFPCTYVIIRFYYRGIWNVSKPVIKFNKKMIVSGTKLNTSIAKKKEEKFKHRAKQAEY